MSDYKEKVKAAYAEGREVNRARETGEYGLEFINTKRILAPYITKESEVVEIGCGGGYYALHFAPRCRRYLGIDLSPKNIEIFREEIASSGQTNLEAAVGDATDLADIADDSYDVVLALGPLYHLNEEDRKRCIRECERIAKPGGILAFAFINKAGAMIKFGNSGGWEHLLTAPILKYALEQGTDDVRTDIFYYTMPEEVRRDAQEAGLSVETVLPLDFLFTESVIESFNEEQKKTWFALAELISNSESLAGLGNHALLVARKK